MDEKSVFSWSVLQTLQIAEAAAQTILDLGLALPGGNRLDRSALRLCSFLEQTDRPGPLDTRQVTQAQQNALEAYVISRQVAARPSPVSIAKLKSVLRGNLLPIDDRKSQSRDTQFEMFLWALATLAGYPDVTFAEPDIVVRWPTGKFGIAAKRIGSRSRMVERVRKAADQIIRSTGQGFIALNVDQIMSAEERPDGLVQSVAADAYACLTGRRREAVEGVLVCGVIQVPGPCEVMRLTYDFCLQVPPLSSESERIVRAGMRKRAERARDEMFGSVEQVFDVRNSSFGAQR